MGQCWSCSWCRWWHYPSLPGCAGSCSSTAVTQLEWKNSQRRVLIICLMTQLSEQCFGSRAEGITEFLLLPDAWHSLWCAGAGAGHIPGIWVGRRLLIHEERWMELCVLCLRSFSCQLVNIGVRQCRTFWIMRHNLFVVWTDCQKNCCHSIENSLCPKGKIKDVFPKWQNWSLHLWVLKIPTPRSWKVETEYWF